MNAIRAKWRGEVLAALPPEEDAVARNAAITRRYARWYVEHRSLCKWAGMAVFASYRVGQILGLASRLRSLRIPGLDGGLRLLRDTNNRVFEDTSWVHAGYLDPRGGIGAVEDGLADLPTHARVLRGFQRIEAGRRMLGDDPGAAADAIWEGSAELLRHEQELFVQPQFADFGALFGAVFSATAVTNYSLGGGHREPTTWFTPDLLLHGRHLVRRNGLLPDIADFDQRWFWIEHHALPLWRRVDAESLPLRARMRDIARGEAIDGRGR